VKASYKNCQARPRYQKDFLQWFSNNRSLFAIPVHLVRRTDKRIEMIFSGVTSDISLQLTRNELMVLALSEGKYFDILADFDIAPERRNGGYICNFCRPEYQVLYPTLSSMRLAEIYEPFLKWVNEKLITAGWIKFYKSPRYFGAELIYEEATMYCPTPGMQLPEQLKNLSEKPMFDPACDQVLSWTVPIFPLNVEHTRSQELT
jgi:hypothetical protein